ncbi:MAG: mycothiol system anti-sigma-R factor [Acidimicrobiales bacterium]|nr:mycothiol system anti-sigma-R factor [Acidimicrobiales bacterium]
MTEQSPDPRAAEPLCGDDPCSDALGRLYNYLDQTLTDDVRTQIRGHLDDCGSCLDAFDFEAELRIVVARKCQDSVPESLRERIARELGIE